jgi:hypothetical protein
MTKEQKLDMFKMRLEGYTYQQNGQQRFRQDQIDKILAVTGLTYEEAFREEYA